ncbi:hypothetical protein EUTSA_v10015863mg [Eutrema salsugineum]|uniref:CCHC-type domain-containing protein n=1 Tax=Eutrema salsugineum TaxID=72664 RepID=V4LIK8_EUTSA|nr:hypothetical protein EUTSA_v10015863mg [Eutrema salsugineum]
MMSAFSSKVKISSKNGVVQPKPTKPNELLEPNTRLEHIEQFHDGKVKLSFIRNHHETIDDYTCESSSLPETIDQGRVSQLAQDFSRMENCPKFQPWFLTSDIPNYILRNVDFRTQIPKPVYKAESSFQHNDFSPKSEPTSPTFSAKKIFKSIKSFYVMNFTPKITPKKRLWFFKKFLKNRNLIQEEFYKYLYEHKMTTAANAYKTQVGNEDRTVAELLIAGFSGQLKGRWDNYLNNQQRSEILDAVKTDEDNVPILDNFGNPQQDAVATLVIAINLHFKGDPSVLRDKNAELLSNLKYKRLSYFQWTSNPSGEKVRNKIRDSTGTQIIDYDDFTYGELISIVQQEGLKICQDLKLQKHLKWELKRTKRFTPKEITNSKPFYKNLTCFKCNKKGHTSKFCRFNRKIQELGLGEELSSQISNLLLDHSSSSGNDSDSSSSGNHDSSSDEQDNDNLDNIEDDIRLKKQIQSLDSTPKDFLCVLREITSRKYKIKITLVFSKNYKIGTIALFDTGTDLNCIKSGLVPKCFHLEKREKLSVANNSKLHITCKAEASVLKDNIFIKTAFVLTDDIYQNFILGTPFINLITPYKVMDDSISFKTQNRKNCLSNFLNHLKSKV